MGIDPGSRKTGFAVIEMVGNKFHYVDSGVLKFDKIENFLDRLPSAYLEAEELLKKYNPDEVALESLIFVKSPTALIKLAQTRGAIIAAFGIVLTDKVFEYAPNLLKPLFQGMDIQRKKEWLRR